jgi:aspartate-semialdehyde dehydrogenase
MSPTHSAKKVRIAVVGAFSLRGKELTAVLEDRNFPASDIILLDESVMAGTLTEVAGEPNFIRPLAEDSFEGAEFVFFAGSAADAERNWLVAQRSGATVIDMTGTISASGAVHSTISIPSLASLLPALPSPGANGSAKKTAYASPSTPVIEACTLAAVLGKFMPQRIAVNCFPPVSERGVAGIEELETQTTKLLTFQPIAQTVFDAQVAFSLLTEYGEESKPRLADVRAAIVKETAGYLAGRAPMPAIQLVQAPVFYGYAFSAFAEFAAPVATGQLEAAFVTAGVKVAAPGDAAPTNISVAGEDEIQIARIETDPSAAAGVWIWGVADNLRLATTNAVRIAEELLAK